MGVGCGLPAWIGEEAALQERSEGFNLERKVETGEMWLLVGGGEVDIFTEAEIFVSV